MTSMIFYVILPVDSSSYITFFGEKFVYYFLYTLIHAILNTNNLVARRSSDPLNRPLNIWLIRTDEGVHQCSLIIRWSKNCDRKVVAYKYKQSFRSSTVAPQVKRTSGQINRMFTMNPESGGLSNMQSLLIWYNLYDRLYICISRDFLDMLMSTVT